MLLVRTGCFTEDEPSPAPSKRGGGSKCQPSLAPAPRSVTSLGHFICVLASAGGFCSCSSPQQPRCPSSSPADTPPAAQTKSQSHSGFWFRQCPKPGLRMEAPMFHHCIHREAYRHLHTLSRGRQAPLCGSPGSFTPRTAFCTHLLRCQPHPFSPSFIILPNKQLRVSSKTSSRKIFLISPSTFSARHPGSGPIPNTGPGCSRSLDASRYHLDLPPLARRRTFLSHLRVSCASSLAAPSSCS